jgi:hypothetical protein
MKFIVAAVAAAGRLAMSQSNAYAGMPGLAGPAATINTDDGLVHKTGRRGRRIATGVAIGLGILGVIAASRAARAHDYRAHDYDDREWRYERRCRRLRQRCLEGSDRACFKFDNHC